TGHIFSIADGTDMLDCVTEIPLPGRIVAPPNATADRSAARNRLPAFVAGPENRLVASAVDDLLQSTSPASREATAKRFVPPLLVLFGPSGTGKSHLAYGLVRHWQSQLGNDSAVYTTAADFRHQLNDAIKRQAELEFRAEFRGRRLLAIDDLQHLPQNDFALQELRFTLDDYEDREATVVVTSTLPIDVLPNLPADLRSRLAGGLSLQLAAPGEAARVRLISQVASAFGQPISAEIAEQLAHGIDGTANHLFSAIFEMFAAASPIETSDSERAAQLLTARAANRPTLREIVAVVARHQNVPQAQLKSSTRRQSIVFARGIVVFLARELAELSYDEIGRALGGRDHTTIIHSYRKIAAERERDPETRQTLEHLQRILLSR
ncbi:MAG TPA: helix-turn-helix domain-containing protein, partial [Lacipirellulaceae bacterium]|nr:helix-turn-helix domain-containing protein [Lacipirellulaceae bacterium]